MTKPKKLEFEKIKVIDLRLGIRLNSIFWPLDITSITRILDKLGYKDVETSPIRSLRAIKSNTEFYSDYSKLVFGFHANTIDSLITAQKEFFASAQKDYETDLDSYVRFYEIENTETYYLENSNKNTISRLFSDSVNLPDLEQIVGEPVAVDKLTLSKKNSSSYDDDWFSVEISPKIESANNAYYCRLIKRTRNLQEITQTLRKSTEMLEKLASSVEEKFSS